MKPATLKLRSVYWMKPLKPLGLMNTDQLNIDFNAPPAPLAVIHGDSLTREEAAVLRLLEAHKGHESAITGEAIAEALNMEKDRPRQVVRHLRERHDILIGATNTKPQGYYLSVTAEDEDLALRNMETRAMSMLKYIAKRKRLALEVVFNQAKLMLEAQTK